MAAYKIECEQFLGFGCGSYGRAYIKGESTIELSDEEVGTLVKLIRERNTTEVDKLGIATSHPELYAKLDKAYQKMARHTEFKHWLWEGYHNGYFEYDEDELMEYCKRECGFTFDYVESDYLDVNGNLNERRLESDMYYAFRTWRSEYIRHLSKEDAVKFMQEHMNAITEDEFDDVEYTVNIPQDIIQMAQETLSSINQ